jgi:hypothetical protein
LHKLQAVLPLSAEKLPGKQAAQAVAAVSV